MLILLLPKTRIPAAPEDFWETDERHFSHGEGSTGLQCSAGSVV